MRCCFLVKDLFCSFWISRAERLRKGKVRSALLWLALYSVRAAPYLSWRNFFPEGDLTVIRRRKSVKEKATSLILGADG